jgi:hypothetical protein
MPNSGDKRLIQNTNSVAMNNNNNNNNNNKNFTENLHWSDQRGRRLI